MAVKVPTIPPPGALGLPPIAAGLVVTIPPVPKVVSRLPAVWATASPPAKPIRAATTLADPNVFLVVFSISNINILLEYVPTLY
jgi:hypothetical protein